MFVLATMLFGVRLNGGGVIEPLGGDLREL